MKEEAAPSLKGITDTNDDPKLCAVCFQPFPGGLCTEHSIINICCGKRACLACNSSGKFFDFDAGRCLLCGVTRTGIGMLKKQAKKGRPWAQFGLGSRFSGGRVITKSSFEAVRWFRKAASHGHPQAHLYLSSAYLLGEGCSRDLDEARRYAELVVALDSSLRKPACDVLLDVGREYINSGAEAKAKEILTILAKEGSVEALVILGSIFFTNEDYGNAKRWSVAVALQGGLPEGHRYNAYLQATFCCAMLGLHCEKRFWIRVISKCDGVDALGTIGREIRKCYETMCHDLQQLRMSCGGCGAALDGATRKMCRGCKTCCYCSRECQVRHWNMPGEDGHRGECLEVMKLNREMSRQAKNAATL